MVTTFARARLCSTLVLLAALLASRSDLEGRSDAHSLHKGRGGARRLVAAAAAAAAPAAAPATGNIAAAEPPLPLPATADDDSGDAAADAEAARVAASLPPCTFAGQGGDAWSVVERFCTPGPRPLQPIVPGQQPGDRHFTLRSGRYPQPPAPAPRLVPGACVFGAPGARGNATLIADAAGSEVTLEGVACFACFDAAAATPTQLFLPRELLRPPPGAPAPAAVALRNIRIIGAGPRDQRRAGAAFRRVVEWPPLKALLQEWPLAVYTDFASYLVVPQAELTALSLLGAGAFVLPALPSPPVAAPFPSASPPRGVNYALALDNGSFHRVLREHAGVDTSTPFFMIVIGNVTFAPHPDLPPGGVDVRRPVTIMGRQGLDTGIDFGGRVNVIRLSGRGNLTFDLLALDNLGWGDEASVRPTRDLSGTLAYALWAAVWPREDRRLVFVRCSISVPDQAQVERLKFFLSESSGWQ